MVLRVFNTMSRQMEEFRPLGETVSVYTCGPTIYNFAHIGNFRAYVCQDVFKRYLKYRGFSVKHVMNLTDVDDKTIRDSQKEGLPLSTFTEKYAKAFFEDIASLNIELADVYPRATEYIEDMISIIEVLLSKGLAYKGEDGSVYYSVRNFPSYGKLSGVSVEGLLSGARVKQDEYAKDQANDFALWKAYDESDGLVYWESPFGRGRPGWHIECSAMAMRNLGETIDVHMGGIDLVFPHHEDEIAQSEGFSGKEFAKYWLHNEYLMVEGRKMSKSLGNFYTLRDVLSKGASGKAVRYLLLATQYRQPLNFTFQSLEGASSALSKLEEFVRNLRAANGTGTGMTSELVACAKRKFEDAMDSDLNVPEALASVFELVRSANGVMNSISPEEAGECIEFMKTVDSVLGVIGSAFTEDSYIPPEIEQLLLERETARSRKDWNGADRIREKIDSLGYLVEDRKEGGSRVRKKTA